MLRFLASQSSYNENNKLKLFGHFVSGVGNLYYVLHGIGNISNIRIYSVWRIKARS